MPNGMSETMPDRISEDTLNKMVARSPDKMAEYMSGRMPDWCQLVGIIALSCCSRTWFVVWTIFFHLLNLHEFSRNLPLDPVRAPWWGSQKRLGPSSKSSFTSATKTCFNFRFASNVTKLFRQVKTCEPGPFLSLACSMCFETLCNFNSELHLSQGILLWNPQRDDWDFGRAKNPSDMSVMQCPDCGVIFGDRKSCKEVFLACLGSLGAWSTNVPWYS